MIDLFLAVGLPVLGGLAWLAVQRPGIYRKLYTPIFFGVLILITLGQVWAMGVMQGIEAIKPFVDPAQMKAAIDATSKMAPPFWVFFLAITGSTLYLIFLDWVAHISKTDSDANTKAKDESTN